MTPEQIRQFLIGILREHQPRDASQLLLDIEKLINEAVKATYLDSVAYIRETASEHNFDIYGKRELEMVANLLELRANGEEIT